MALKPVPSTALSSSYFLHATQQSGAYYSTLDLQSMFPALLCTTPVAKRNLPSLPQLNRRFFELAPGAVDG